MSDYDFNSPPSREDSDSLKWGRYAARDIIPAWVADMDFAAPPPILAALQKRVAHGVFGYAQTPNKLLTISTTVVEYFERRWQWKINPEWIIYLPGLGAAIHNVCRMAEGGDILTPSPIYHVFRKAPIIAGAKRIDMPLTLDNGEWHQPLSMVEQSHTPNSRVLQLCNPHNPGGKIYTRDELLQLGEFCLRHNLILCADEVHADLILDKNQRHIPIAALDKDIARLTITLQSPSKAFNIAGLNFAVAVISDEELRQKFYAHLAGKVITHLNPLGMAAAQSAWSGECDNWLAALIIHLRKNHDTLLAATQEIAGITMPPLASTYLAWLHVKESGLSPADFEKAGVGMSCGADFGDAEYMRLNFGCSAALLQQMIDRLRQAVA